MNHKFYLKEPNGQISQLYVRLQWTKAEMGFSEKGTGKRLKIYLPINVETKHWDQKLQRVKELRSYQDSWYINGVISKVDSLIKTIYQNAVVEGLALSSINFKDEILSGLGGQASGDTSVIDLFEKFIEDCHGGVRLKEDGSMMEKESIRSYENAKQIFGLFEQYYKVPLYARSIGGEFALQFEQLCQQRNFSHNYRVTMVKRLKAVLNYFNKDGKYERSLHNVRSVKASYEQADTIALTKEEIQAIYELDLTDDPILDRMRDCFIAEYCTLTRYSDASRIKELNLEDDIIRIVTKKTKTVVELPYHWMLKEIIVKYDGFPKPPVAQYYNREIKNVVRRAGITRIQEIKVKKGGRTFTEEHPRYTLVSSHTARRSAATNMALDGIPWEKIMLLTGHTTRATFAAYIRVEKRQNALDLAKHSFFTGKE